MNATTKQRQKPPVVRRQACKGGAVLVTTAQADQASEKGPSWDELQVGLVVGPLHYTITEEMISDFCAALPVAEKPYQSPSGAASVMPPTLLATDYIPLLKGHLELGWGLMARHSMKVLRPVKVNDVVMVRGKIIDKYEKKGRRYWTLQYDVTNSSGQVCSHNTISCSVD